MKRPSSRALLPSKEIGLNSSKLLATDSKISHRNSDASAFTRADSTLSVLAGGAALTSQDLNLDWSKFENHTFFDSAAAKVNAAFLRVINEYPYDGSQKEAHDYFVDLSGFERYIYDLFPKSIGYYNFAGSSHVAVKDSTGAEFPDFSGNNIGTPVLDPAGGPITIQMYLSASSAANGNQIIAQYAQNQATGITLFLSQSSTAASASLCFAVCSGSLSASVVAPIAKGEFQHVAAVYLSSAVTSSLEIYRNGVLAATSSGVVRIGDSIGASSFTVASGSSFSLDGTTFLPTERLNAAIDDLRVYHSARTAQQIRYNMSYPGYSDSDDAQEGLRLYYKFNEPPGSHVQAAVALDSSGYCLHSKIIGYTDTQRVTGSSALDKETAKLSPVLYPDYHETAALNQELLTSGSQYDSENPNYIVRLVPAHYFLEGQQDMSFAAVQGEIDSLIQGDSIPGSGKLGSVQIMTALLLMYAKVFDEIKIFHDHFSKLTYVEYDSNNSVSDSFLTFLASYYGIELPSLFRKSTIDQFLLGEKLQTSSAAELPLRAVQSAIFRRILTNIRDIITSKGTHAGVKALFNAAGIAPNSFFRIREFGGASEISLSDIRDEVTEVASSIDMSGSLAPLGGTIDSLGFSSASPVVLGSFLSGSRSEVGFPQPSGIFVPHPGTFHGLSSTLSDGLLTSGSWTFEASYRFGPVEQGNQSLARMHVTGTSAPSSTHGVVFNIVAKSGSATSINAYVSADSSGGATPVALHITGANVFDGNRWHVALSRMRNDDPAGSSDIVSSSYTLRCARISAGGTPTFYSSSGYFDEGAIANNVLQSVSSFNTSGSFIVFGSQSFTSAPSFLNNSSLSAEMREANLSGRVSSARFWSKAFSDTEFREHARSYRSLGVDSPVVNFGFNTTSTGSFEKLRMDLSFDQELTGSDSSGQLNILDMSQQRRDALARGFEANTTIIKPDVQRFTQISTRFDARQTTEKVRVRSFTEVENLIDFPGSVPAPIYEQTRSESPVSDSRISVEASAVDAINDDIVKLLSSLDFFEAAMGDPRVLNEDDYPDLEKLRRVYFNRLVARPDLRAMYNVFKWVSDSLGEIIAQLVPMNSVFLGVSYIVESHIAERARVRYYFDSVYKEKTVTENSAKDVKDLAGATSKDSNTASSTKSVRG